LTYNHDGKYLVLDISKVRLESAPRYWGADIIDKDWMEGVYRYYGLQPYWTEGGFSGMEHHMMGKPVKD